MACEQAGDAQILLEDIFTALSDDLDAPRALNADDQWAQDSIARGMPRASDLPSINVAVVLDALLGIKLY